LQHFGRSAIFGITNKDGGRRLNYHLAFGHVDFFGRGQNVERANGVVDLSVREVGQTDNAGENAFNSFHNVGD
jgi:predicted Fe-Mo cluster-binding NifX family protein